MKNTKNKLVSNKSKKIDPEIRHIVLDYAAHLRREKVPIKSLYVFGSRVQGKAKRYSDIDVCIVSPILSHAWWKNSRKLWRVRHKVDSRIEPHGYAPEDFVIEDPLVYEIKKRGIKIL